MTDNTTHWTEGDIEAYAFRLAFDFTTYIKNLGDDEKLNQTELAARMGVSKGRVSQILNNPGNLTLKQMVKVARAIGQKVSVVTYDDKDPKNEHGPINGDVFTGCWAFMSRPRDMMDLAEAKARVGKFRIRTILIHEMEWSPDNGPAADVQQLRIVNGTSTNTSQGQLGFSPALPAIGELITHDAIEGECVAVSVSEG